MGESERDGHAMNKHMTLKQAAVIAALAAATCPPFAYAVDGIAVSCRSYNHWWPPSRWGGEIVRYTIENDDMVSEQVLYDGDGRCATINLSGTHVAFFRATDEGDYVSVVPIDGGEVVDLVKMPYENAHKGYMDWPAGDWIYYNMGGERSEGSRHLRRVKYNDPASDEAVIDFQAAIWQWGISADARRMVLVVSDGDNYGVDTYALPGNGSLQGTGGCGGYISPSGLYGTNLTDPEHTRLNLWNFDGSGDDFGVSSFNINGWAVNAEVFATECSGCGGTITVGVGMDQNRWSCNSDKWVCISIGWPGGNCGRFGSCGFNQVLVNWQDEKTVMVSKNKRVCDDNNDGKFDDCDLHDPDGQFTRNEAGDFWVSGPLEDINEDLRRYVTDPSRVPRGDPRGMGGETGFSVRRLSGGVIKIHSRPAGPYTVEVHDAAGRRVARTSFTGPGMRRLLPGQSGRGLYFVRIRSSAGSLTRAIPSL
jgi:hypothetical protein